MRLSGKRHVAASPQALWATLADPERLGSALPGVDGVEKTGDTACRATVRASTGLGVTTFSLELTVSEQDEPHRARIEARGVGGEQRVDAVIDVALAAAEGGTEVSWDADARFAGVVSSLGQQVLGGLVRQHIEGAIGTAQELAGS